MGLQLSVNEAGEANRVASADDVRAFEEQLKAHAVDGLRLARYLGSESQDAADVVQEASILAWRYRKTRRGEWKPWFLSIVRRVAHRRLEKWTLIPTFWQPASDSTGQDFFGGSEVAVALARLPRRQRAAVWLRYGQDLAYRDVGEVLGIREAAAKMLVARGRAAMKAELETRAQRRDS
jgi:RNA polymerase sigma-70 factor, ECF subfamily